TGVWLRAVRWGVLMRPLGSISARQLFPVVVVGYMANNVLPLRTGELVRSVVVRQKFGIRKTSALATIAVERLFDGLTMLAFMLLATAFVSFTSELENLAIIAFVLFTVLLLGLFLLTLGGSFVDRLLQLVLGPMPTALADRVERMAESFLSGLGIFRSRRDLLLVSGLSLLAWLFEASMYWVLAIGFGGSVREAMGAAETLLTTGVANMATLIPSSPGYIGQFEYGVKLVLSGALGVPEGPALAYAILVHAVLYFPITAWGIWEWFRQQLSWREIQASSEELAASEVPDRSVMRPERGSGNV
ncbi:MAG TPA: lysylphosphatidylglycerol synthase transmembrane domain-containing protein, partial [Thermomicrobiales bacterium]|nr:lysylphosphatidylglycerol synthase transmembrane domain-containing protein [Thermomicrobiales bacterium]